MELEQTIVLYPAQEYPKVYRRDHGVCIAE